MRWIDRWSEREGECKSQKEDILIMIIEMNYKRDN